MLVVEVVEVATSSLRCEIVEVATSSFVGCRGRRGRNELVALFVGVGKLCEIDQALVVSQRHDSVSRKIAMTTTTTTSDDDDE